MTWIVCFFISAAIFALSIFLAIISQKAVRKKGKLINGFNILFGGVVLSATVLFVPVHSLVFKGDLLGAFKTIFISAQNTMQMFTADSDFSFINENISGSPDIIAPFYSLFASLLFVMAPVFTFGFVLSFFKNLSAHIRYICSYFKDTYIFSELNDKSLVLANDIKKKNPKVAIVFNDVFESNEESSYELIEKASMINAICFKKDILVVNYGNHSAKRNIYFFTIGENETENIDQSLKLIKTYSERKNTHLFVFSTRIESELLLTSAGKGAMKVRRINEVRSMINRILFDDGVKLFENARAGEDGKKTVSAVVVGMGRHGTEMLKALAWFGQMDGYNIEIDAFDKDKLAEQKFTALCPELMSPKYNGVHVEGEAEYSIVIHSKMDIDTKDFADEIMKLTKASYVLVALGKDEDNIKTAVQLRMLFERMGINPVIQTIVYNSDQKRALEGIKNYRGQAYNIDFIGDMESSYTTDVIIDSELEDEALKSHLKWGKEEEFWQYEYNYRSSLASAIHRHTRIKLKMVGAGKAEDQLTEEERRALEVLEHRRWNAYMRSEGYIYSGSPDKSSRNDLAKMHHDLVDFDSLSEEDKRKDSRVGSAK